jgi:hypothetical protein
MPKQKTPFAKEGSAATQSAFENKDTCGGGREVDGGARRFRR